MAEKISCKSLMYAAKGELFLLYFEFEWKPGYAFNDAKIASKWNSKNKNVSSDKTYETLCIINM